MAISKDSDDTLDPGQAGKPDLDAWRAEAGAALATPFLGYSEAARTGWPRDAARVAALVDRVAALEAHVATLAALKAVGDRQEALADRFAARCEVLEAALLDAAAFIEPPPNAYLSPSVLFAARDKAAELRAIAAGTSATTGEEPAR
jgi:hypothetical protein